MSRFSQKLPLFALLTALLVAGTAKGSSLAAFLRPFDADQNGRLDAEEAQAARDYRRQLREQRRNTIDLNDDGQISPAEVRAARKQIRETILERRQKRFTDLAGQDGLLTVKELALLPQLLRVNPDYLNALFVRLDADEDGAVTFEEFSARLR